MYSCSDSIAVMSSFFFFFFFFLKKKKKKKSVFNFHNENARETTSIFKSQIYRQTGSHTSYYQYWFHLRPTSTIALRVVSPITSTELVSFVMYIYCKPYQIYPINAFALQNKSQLPTA